MTIPGHGISDRVPILIVAAVAENGVIGCSGALPWRLKSDLRHFREITWGKPVIMGRRTFLSIGRALPGRTNIVVSRSTDFCGAGAIVTPDLGTGLALGRADAQRRGADAIVIAGGAEVYARTLPLAERIALTRVHLAPEGDVLFPPIDPALWREAARTEHGAGAGDDAAFARIVYERTRPDAA
jgi:dihydrofolate reductase